MLQDLLHTARIARTLETAEVVEGVVVLSAARAVVEVVLGRRRWWLWTWRTSDFGLPGTGGPPAQCFVRGVLFSPSHRPAYPAGCGDSEVHSSEMRRWLTAHVRTKGRLELSKVLQTAWMVRVSERTHTRSQLLLRFLQP